METASVLTGGKTTQLVRSRAEKTTTVGRFCGSSRHQRESEPARPKEKRRNICQSPREHPKLRRAPKERPSAGGRRRALTTDALKGAGDASAKEQCFIWAFCANSQRQGAIKKLWSSVLCEPRAAGPRPSNVRPAPRSYPSALSRSVPGSRAHRSLWRVTVSPAHVAPHLRRRGRGRRLLSAPVVRASHPCRPR